ncbi:MAG: J domain-containing protein [Vicinamibacterales bacterium]|nr:J domain-containing protein [Vicinamibacterales bacterium]
MPAGATFAEVLDRALDEDPARMTGGTGRPPRGRVLPFPPRIDGGAIPFRATAYARMAGVPRPPAPVSPGPASAAVPIRPRRVLTARAQAALHLFAELGAGVPADFTDEELRRAFRTLARLVHPDRHPGASPDEHARLSRLFARVMAAYRDLR